MTTSPSVRVKSHFFDLFITQKRLILTQPDFPDASPVEIVFSSVSAFSRTKTPEGDPSLSVTIISGERERTMVLVFDGAGGLQGADERDRVAELVQGMVTETANLPSTAPVSSAAPATDAATPDTAALPSDGAEENAKPTPVAEVLTTPSSEKPAVSGLKAEHIIVKGHEFTASLTKEAVTLVRHEDPKASPLTVRRTDIIGVISKTSAGGDPSLHLRVRAAGGTERTMVLVFSEWYSGGRAPERDEWARALIETAAVSEMPPARRMSAAPVAGRAKFCTECGAPLTGSPRFCPNCGAPLAAGSAAKGGSGGIRDIPFDAATVDESPVKKRKTKQKREKPERRQKEPRTRRKSSFRFPSQERGLSEVPFIEKYFGFLAAPEDAFRYTKNDSFGQAMVYLAAVLAIFGTVTSILLHLFAGSLDAAEYPQMAALGADIVGALLLIPRIVIIGIVAVLIWSVVMHILLRIFGQSDDVTETFRTCAYAATPFGTVGLIPFFGPLAAAIWMLFLQYKGLVAADDVEERFALIAVAVPVILFIAIFSLFFSAGGSQ
ncbi:YIP1 family protein [Methanogenium organophilum]|uniref:YIP1 family protein n=1 Tax=Methanogenium organophilum TaxID=2199 RepID=A0A9X9S699_METOG|nr:YIP1 family protein [Methanogenium organophilum]WAI02461.1 YIP1 family protein [Methanogenium organophilum]